MKATKIENIDYYNYNSDNRDLQNFKKFMEICNMVFPLKIEEQYVELANAVSNYINCCHKLNSNNSNIDVGVKKISNESIQLLDFKATEEKLRAQLSEIYAMISAYASSDSYKKLEEISQKLLESSLKREKLEEKLKQQQIVHNENSIIANEQRNDISSSVNAITSSLRTISQLDQDENKRISGIEISDKHLQMIDSFDTSDEIKAAYKFLLSSYINMRLECFKFVEEMSFNLLEGYKNHELLESFSEQQLADCYLALFMLNNINLEDKKVHNMNIQTVNDECMIMGLISGHFKGNDISREMIASFMEKHVDYQYYEAIKLLLNNPSTTELENTQGISI